jgi:adenine nucleotide transporter 17
MALFWPLEKIRLEVQSQTQSKLHEPGDKFTADAHPKEEVTVVSCIKHIWRTKGVTGFYQGIESALYGTCASQLVFFYLYSFLKSAHARRGGALGPLENTAIASISGAINALLTSPIWLVNTRIAVQKADVPAADRLNGLCDGMAKIARREGVAALWDGIAPALVLVSNPVIQFVCYEQVRL